MPKNRTPSDMVDSMPSDLEELRRQLRRGASLVLDIKVIPRAHTGEIAQRMANGTLKVKVTAAPERGRANDEVCALLARYLKVPKRNVEIILGHTSPQKRVRISL